MNLVNSISNPDARQVDCCRSGNHQGFYSRDPEKEAEDPNTDQSGIKDDRKHDAEDIEDDDDDDHPDLSGDINI